MLQAVTVQSGCGTWRRSQSRPGGSGRLDDASDAFASLTTARPSRRNRPCRTATGVAFVPLQPAYSRNHCWMSARTRSPSRRIASTTLGSRITHVQFNRHKLASRSGDSPSSAVCVDCELEGSWSSVTQTHRWRHRDGPSHLVNRASPARLRGRTSPLAA